MSCETTNATSSAAAPANKPMIVVATKMDAAQDPERVESLRIVAKDRGLEFFEISSATGQGKPRGHPDPHAAEHWSSHRRR